MDPIIFDKAKFNMRLRKTLERVRKSCGLDRLIFSEMLDIGIQDYVDGISGRKDFKSMSLWNLSQEIGLNINLIFSGEIDYGALSRQFYGTRHALPDKYEVNRLSRTRTLSSMFRYVSDSVSPDYSEMILGRYQVNPVLLNDIEGFVSPWLLTDLLDELRREEFEDEDIRSMGRMSFFVNRDNPILADILSKAESPKQLYCILIQRLLGFFDRIWNYRIISAKDDYCLVEIKLRDESMETFKTKVVGTKSLCLLRQGVFSSCLGYFGMAGLFAAVDERECMHDGDERCLFRISWPNYPGVGSLSN